MTISKKILTLSALGILSVSTLSFVTIARADTNNDSLANKIANKFNINEEEVNKVIDEHHNEKHSQHQADINAKLDQLVNEGKITSEQKNKLISRFEEMKSQRKENKEQFESMTHDERHTKMQEKKTEMDKWLEDNGIDKSVIEELMPHKGGRGHNR